MTSSFRDDPLSQFTAKPFCIASKVCEATYRCQRIKNLYNKYNSCASLLLHTHRPTMEGRWPYDFTNIVFKSSSVTVLNLDSKYFKYHLHNPLKRSPNSQFYDAILFLLLLLLLVMVVLLMLVLLQRVMLLLVLMLLLQVLVLVLVLLLLLLLLLLLPPLLLLLLTGYRWSGRKRVSVGAYRWCCNSSISLSSTANRVKP